MGGRFARKTVSVSEAESQVRFQLAKLRDAIYQREARKSRLERKKDAEGLMTEAERLADIRKDVEGSDR